MPTAFFIPDNPGSGSGATERFFVYNPDGVAAGNVYTDWALMFTAISTLQVGEMPVVSVVGVQSVPVVVPTAGMPVNGWDMRGGSILSFYRSSTEVELDCLTNPGVMFDNLFEIGNGLRLHVAPAAGTGVLNFSLFPNDGGPFVFVIGLAASVVNDGPGALVRSRGGATSGTYVMVLLNAVQGAIFTPPSAGPLLELTGDDSAVLSVFDSVGGMPGPPGTPNSWLQGGSLASTLFILTDASGTLPSEWGATTFPVLATVQIYPTMRNGLKGTTADRALFIGLAVGTIFFDITIGFPVWWDGVTPWVDAAGAPA